MGDVAVPVCAATGQTQDECSDGPQCRQDKCRQRDTALWPPKGWPMFACITRASGMATCKKAGTPEGCFLKYDAGRDGDIYTLEIMAGRMTRAGTHLQPANTLRFKPLDDPLGGEPERGIIDLRVGDEQLPATRMVVLRAILAMTYVISRIDRGIAPDLPRVLKTYQLT